MFVAVVYRDGGSRRSDDTFSCFVAETADEAIQEALAAVRKWGPRTYRVLVGPLTTEAAPAIDYTLTPLV